MLAVWRRRYERLLEWIVIALMAALAVEVTAGVVFRYSGYALVWYDEVAALAALKRAHIGVPELVRGLPPGLRLPLAMLAEASVLAFFILLAWVGYAVLEVLATDNLVSLPRVSVTYTQSVIPIGAVLFIIAEAMALPEVWREARAP